MVTTQFTSIHISDSDSGYVVIHQTLVSKGKKRREGQFTTITWKMPIKLKLVKQKVKRMFFFWKDLDQKKFVLTVLGRFQKEYVLKYLPSQTKRDMCLKKTTT